jgi:hypothetical protein
MESKKQYWLVTVKEADCSGYHTMPITKHPADYMAKHIDEALIFAMPLTKKQFHAVAKAYGGD